MLLLVTLGDLPAQLLTGCFLDGGRNLFGLFDRLGLPDFFGDRFLLVDARALQPSQRRTSSTTWASRCTGDRRVWRVARV